MEAGQVTALLMPGGRLYFEMDLGVVVLAVLVVAFLLALMVAVGYHYGRKRIAGRVARELGRLEGKVEALTADNAEAMKLIARQAEQIGSVRGTGKHLLKVGI